jgi:hypothetical protein
MSYRDFGPHGWLCLGRVSGQRGATTGHHIYFWASLIVTVVVTVWLTHVARDALRKAMPKEAVREAENLVQRGGPRRIDQFVGNTS